MGHPLKACSSVFDRIELSQRLLFYGSCMTNIGHFRAVGKLLELAGEPVPSRLWIAPPTKMDERQLKEEGFYNLYAAAGARTELPGCSLCMGNQARVAAGATVVSTSTRNFPNRLGSGAQVFLVSAELAAVAAVLGRLPTAAEYATYAHQLDTMAPEIYRFLGFDRMPAHTAVDEGGEMYSEIDDDRTAPANSDLSPVN